MDFPRPHCERSLAAERDETPPPGLREGGYLTIQFTGYLPAHIRGAQIAKEVLAGQSFVGGG